MLNIKGLIKAEVLKGLYDNSKPQGLGFLNYNPGYISIDEAEKLLKEQTYFDYLNGRVMKVDLSSDNEFEEWLYDRDNGVGSAKRVIDKLRGSMK
ncbi:MAG: hypothetical protein RSC24_06315 [Clostridium sp.]